MKTKTTCIWMSKIAFIEKLAEKNEKMNSIWRWLFSGFCFGLAVCKIIACINPFYFPIHDEMGEAAPVYLIRLMELFSSIAFTLSGLYIVPRSFYKLNSTWMTVLFSSTTLAFIIWQFLLPTEKILHNVWLNGLNSILSGIILWADHNLKGITEEISDPTMFGSPPGYKEDLLLQTEAL
ncbi:hypothetical protein PROFUN_13790 [Planoprotostelium fungivorum]|uniref:Uncharacterized protein n=1 Tax=Planoprotostelium fungivorum TaxID=1890364 RepID=A0A2P6N343_9EUKA|nr:hypothetical protein PROFUN_13790 [Planoprotostelium fungivorum]